MLAGHNSQSYVYYTFRRVLEPDMFKLNFAYQSYFMRKFHKGEYTLNMFYRYNLDVDSEDKSPLIIELGFNLYYLLILMKKHFQYDMDEKYNNHLLNLISPKESSSATINKNIFLTLIDFAIDFYNLCTRCCRSHTRNVSIERVHKIKDDPVKMRTILSFYSKNAAQIEILKDGVLAPRFFPILPFCRFSSELPKEKFKREVVRTNAKTKCESLMKESKLLITDLKVNYWLRTGLTRFVGLLQKYLDMLRSLTSYLSIALNLIVLLSYTNEVGTRSDDPELLGTSVTLTETLFITLGIITLVVVMIVFSNSVINKIPIKIKRYKVFQDEKMKRLTQNGKLATKILTPREEVFRKVREIFTIGYYVMTDLLLVYYFGVLILTLLGVVYHPFFYTYLLTYPVLRSPPLMNVLQAIWYPRETLLLTICLMFTVIYALTVISFWAYADDYTENDCYSLLSCFVVSFDNTFKNDGGLGGYLSSAYRQKESTMSINTDRVLFDNISFLLVGVLLIEIISGIIIDTFAELRQKNNDIKQDSKANCFICDSTREELEKHYGANGFEYHTMQYHNLWDYLFFIAYLESKRGAEGKIENSDERYVSDKIQNDDHSWLPCYM